MLVFAEITMEWFEKNRSLFDKDPLDQMYAWLHEAQIHISLNNMAGPTGVSRFMLYYKRDRAEIIIEDISTIPLSIGGLGSH